MVKKVDIPKECLMCKIEPTMGISVCRECGHFRKRQLFFKQLMAKKRLRKVI
jgi:hypothetical protein